MDRVLAGRWIAIQQSGGRVSSRAVLFKSVQPGLRILGCNGSTESRPPEERTAFHASVLPINHHRDKKKPCSHRCIRRYSARLITVDQGKRKKSRRRATFPCVLHSIIAAEGLNFRVRNGNGCGPLAVATGSENRSSVYFPRM